MDTTTKTRPSLYEVGAEGAEIEQLLIEAEGELTPELEARLDAHLAGGAAKLDAAAFVLWQLEAMEAFCKDESARLALRARMFARNADMLKARMLEAVDRGFGGKVKTGRFTLYGQTSAPGVAFDVAADADYEAILAADPRLVRTKHELNRTMLKLLHDEGARLPAAVTVTETPGKRSLRVR